MWTKIGHKAIRTRGGLLTLGLRRDWRKTNMCKYVHGVESANKAWNKWEEFISWIMGSKMGLRRIEAINQGIKACFDFDGEVTKVDES